jgi:hypothetical protein
MIIHLRLTCQILHLNNKITYESLREQQKDKLPIKYFDYVTFASHLSSSNDHDAPTTIKEALSNIDAKKWKESLNSEYNSFMKNNTWTLENLLAWRSIATSGFWNENTMPMLLSPAIKPAWWLVVLHKKKA